MTEERVKVLLEEAYSRICSGALFEKARKKYEKLKIYPSRFSAPGDYADAAALLEKLKDFPADVLEEEADRLVYLAGAGTNSMNPVIVEILVRDGNVEISAWAKEGLIKQRTAWRAQDAFAEALELK